MRSLGTVCVLVAWLASCGGAEPLGTKCAVSTDCGAGQVCVDGACQVDPSNPLPVGEGEGGHEGEGGPGEGEGSVGEGEGSPGEGEGSVGEGEGSPGEGEGSPGEGEGEGGGLPPTCTPSCGPLMDCTATDVCQDSAGSDVCDAFVSGTADFFADQTLVLDGTVGNRYRFDDGTSPPGDRFYRSRQLVLTRANMTIDVQIASTAFDPVVYVFNDTGGTCQALAHVDDPNDGAAIEEFTIGANGVDIPEIVVTSFDTIDDAGLTSGSYTLRTRGIVCADGPAAGDETDTQATYDQCFRALFETANTTNTCANSNPCARDVNGHSIGKFCALNANAGHIAGTPIILKQDLATCCGTGSPSPCP